MRFAVFGAGWWAPYQLSGWRELAGVECVAVYNRTRERAERLARQFDIPAVYDDPEALLGGERLDFVDVITDVDTHPRFVAMAAARGLPVISQKPMGPSLAASEEMVRTCREAGVPFFVHENWRWQPAIRQVRAALDSGRVGRPFRARISMVSAYPVFRDQPFLAELEQFILTDMGSHLLDVARFLFGEATRLYCETHRVHAHIRGEDVATVMLHMDGAPYGGREVTVTCELGYPGHAMEHDRFPETFMFIEGERGTVELAPDYWVRTTTGEGTFSRRCPPPPYPWAQTVVQASTVACNADLLRALRGEGPAETTGEDNLRTIRLVYAAYASATSGQAVTC